MRKLNFFKSFIFLVAFGSLACLSFSLKADIIAAGNGIVYLVCPDSTVWAAGRNDVWQIGDSTTTNRSIAVMVHDLTGIIAVAAGIGHGLALDKDGNVWAWGNGNALGDSIGSQQCEPIKILALTNIIAIDAGISTSMALRDDGTVWMWGGNDLGQLGDGTTVDKNFPIQVTGIAQVVAIQTGGSHTVVLTKYGTIWAWGGNWGGQLGDSTTTDSSIPLEMTSIGDFTEISASDETTMALKKDGTLWVWGAGNNGCIGHSSLSDALNPVSFMSNVTAIRGAYQHSFIVKEDGFVWAWGRNDLGQLGNGTTFTMDSVPGQVSGIAQAVEIAGADASSYVVKSDGTVWSFGANFFGQLGDGTIMSRSNPVQMSLPCLVESCDPTADFSTSDSVLQVNFTNTTNNFHTSIWSFGDGDSAFAANPTHTYDSAGTYNVCVRIFSNCGYDEFCKDVTVEDSMVGINPRVDILNSILIYPNPAENQLTLDFSKTGLSDIGVSLINSLGISVYALEAVDTSESINLDISGLPIGLYFVRISTSTGESFTKRVVKVE